MAVMLVLGIVTSALFGRVDNTAVAMISSFEDTVKLLFSMGGMICFWSGVMKIAEKSEILSIFTKLLRPFLSKLFPGANDKAMAAIITNIAANLLGLGNAATPMGLIAMSELKKTALDEKRASEAMITFVIFNTVGLQIIPTTVAALRLAAGSEDPFWVLIPTAAVSFISLMAALIPTIILNKSAVRK